MNLKVLLEQVGDDLKLIYEKNVKKMECGKIITPESKICYINYQGFSVITQNNFWEIRRG